MSWTDDRVELLKKYWADGLTCSEIAAKMGGITRNAVIGKVHRLGLGGRSKDMPRRGGGKKGRPGAVPKPSPSGNTKLRQRGDAAIQPAIDWDAISQDFDKTRLTQGALTIAQLERQHCRFPIGDPSTPELRYCGAQSQPGLPYCHHHAQRAYQPPKVKSRSRERTRNTQSNPAKLIEPA